jgi:hypothetical protein
LPNPFKIEAIRDNRGKIHNVQDEIHEEFQKHDQKYDQKHDQIQGHKVNGRKVNVSKVNGHKTHNHKTQTQEVGHGTGSEGDLETPAGSRKSVQARGAYTARSYTARSYTGSVKISV